MARAAPLLHVLTDPHLSRGRSHLEVVEAALAGGADVIQFRDKMLSGSRLTEVAWPLREATRRAGRVFIVNDSLELASSVDADGLHIGEGDLEVALARRMWTAPKVLGVSARTPARARAAASEGADYLGTGPVFGTTSKANAPEAIGLTGLRGVIAQVSIPVIAIGGVDAANAALAIEAGASGVAVISSVVAADDVERATHELRRAIDEAFRGARRGWV